MLAAEAKRTANTVCVLGLGVLFPLPLDERKLILHRLIHFIISISAKNLNRCATALLQ